ncbi:HPP family protein [Corynebacterium sp. H113]|uniref:HPP family protein n=1 Tax=Corynebacterium sp. H113 TaxID=3133419 RepID=UPI0030A8B039
MKSNAPPRPPVLHIITASLALTLPLLFIALLATQTTELLFIPSIGAAAALIVGAPSLPLAQPRNVIIGHLVGATVGVLAMHTLGSNALSAAVASGVTFGLMLSLRSAHSPAVATAIVAVLSPPDNDLHFIGVVFVASVLVVVLALVANRVRKLHYPHYWW